MNPDIMMVLYGQRYAILGSLARSQFQTVNDNSPLGVDRHTRALIACKNSNDGTVKVARELLELSDINRVHLGAGNPRLIRARGEIGITRKADQFHAEFLHARFEFFARLGVIVERRNMGALRHYFDVAVPQFLGLHQELVHGQLRLTSPDSGIADGMKDW